MTPRRHTLRRLGLGALPLLMLFASCRHQAPYVYISDAPRDTPTEISTRFGSLVAPGDLLYIYVQSNTPESVVRFNEETNSIIPGLPSQPPQGYLVSDSGTITYPVLGTIPVEGLTISEVERAIETRLRLGRYVSDPVATVKLLNFHVAVIGEVHRPQLVHCDGNRLTILEAIAQCGDVTIDGLRDRVVVVRYVGDDELVDTVDLTRKELFNSPYYYLQQNDIVYVEPSDKKKRRGTRNEEWPQYVTIGVSVLNLAYRTIYRIGKSQ